MAPREKFHAIIVGGGVAGLTLAVMLEQFDIEYTLLEAHKEIAPAVGASIGLFPNGLRIIDQLGCYETVRKVGLCEQDCSHIRDKNGNVIVFGKPHPFMHMEPRHGYPVLFFDRQWLLQILYDRVQNKDRILLGKRVVGIDHVDGGVEVTTKDGSLFKGTLVVGVDGVHSTTRQLMFSLGNQLQPGYFPPDEEEHVACYYQCSFGIAEKVPNWVMGDTNIVLGDDKSQLVISGPENRVYWFLFQRLPEATYGKSIPKCTKEDEQKFIQKNFNLTITKTVTLGDLYTHRLSSTLTPLHEMVYKKWFFKRIMIFGDAAHKPNPISGQGGNGAIESAAEFVNVLTSKRDNRSAGLSNLTDEDIQDIFAQTQAARNAREVEIVKSAHEQQALNAYENRLKSTLIWGILTKLMGLESRLARPALIYLDSPFLKKLPVPRRARVIPYKDELPAKPVKNLASNLARLIFMLGMGLLFYISIQALRSSSSESSRFGLIMRTWMAQPRSYGFFDQPIAAVPHESSGQNLAPVWYLPYLLSQLISPLLIYTIEGHRIGNEGTLLSLSSLYTIGIQTFGISRVAPLHALITALMAYELPTGRFVHPAAARALIPALVLGYILPAVSFFLPLPITDSWQSWTTVSQVTPLLFPAFLALFRAILERRQRHNAFEKSEKDAEFDCYKFGDVSALKSVYVIAFCAQAIAHFVAIACFYSWSDRSIANMLSSLSLGSEIGGFFKHDVIIAFTAIVISNLFSIWDLRRLGYITTSDAFKATFRVVTSQVIFGPGATWAGLWYWRENMIISLSLK
ncbi:FAD binding domain protein [Whalleya microplaca]|nr:FAD binding domain protein [Whalleya microplaca]